MNAPLPHLPEQVSQDAIAPASLADALADAHSDSAAHSVDASGLALSDEPRLRYRSVFISDLHLEIGRAHV
jgi:hypothetical protein